MSDRLKKYRLSSGGELYDTELVHPYAVTVYLAPDVDAEIQQLRATLIQVEQERDILKTQLYARRARFTELEAQVKAKLFETERLCYSCKGY